jgi:uncharacterized membrane protein
MNWELMSKREIRFRKGKPKLDDFVLRFSLLIPDRIDMKTFMLDLRDSFSCRTIAYGFVGGFVVSLFVVFGG